MAEGKETWEVQISPSNSLFSVGWSDLWRYRDLLILFVRRDFVSQFKQTVLGPLWFFIQPIFTTIIFTVVFGRLASISTDGIPQPLFYLSGIILWNYFADCLTKTTETFTTNQHIFGKVYFPRLIVPLSIVVSNLLRFGVQFMLFVVVYLYFYFNGEVGLPEWWVFITPVLVLLVAGLGLGLGLIVSSLTTKYRDLKFLIQFGVQLAMYASPIVYPVSIISDKMKWLILANPISSLIESFRYVLFGDGYVSSVFLTYSGVLIVLLLLFGVVIFNHQERSFIDTV